MPPDPVVVDALGDAAGGLSAQAVSTGGRGAGMGAAEKGGRSIATRSDAGTYFLRVGRDISRWPSASSRSAL